MAAEHVARRMPPGSAIVTQPIEDGLLLYFARPDVRHVYIEATTGCSLMHSYPYYIYGRRKNVTRYVLGNVHERSLTNIWMSGEYVRFRGKVRDFRFTSCVDCGMACSFAADNEDCLTNSPSCADCLWAQDIIRCP